MYFKPCIASLLLAIYSSYVLSQHIATLLFYATLFFYVSHCSSFLILHNHFTIYSNNLNFDYALIILAVPYLDLDGDETTGMKTLVM